MTALFRAFPSLNLQIQDSDNRYLHLLISQDYIVIQRGMLVAGMRDQIACGDCARPARGDFGGHPAMEPGLQKQIQAQGGLALFNNRSLLVVVLASRSRKNGSLIIVLIGRGDGHKILHPCIQPNHCRILSPTCHGWGLWTASLQHRLQWTSQLEQK